MFTVIVLWLLAIAWLVANGMFAQKPSPVYRRRRAVLSWALVGGCAGAFAGLASPALSLPGSIAGAVAVGLIAARCIPLA